MSSSRSRSVSRERVIRQSSLFPSGRALDPHALLSDVLPKLTTTDIPLNVTITDGTNSVTYSLNTFLSKDYEVRKDSETDGVNKVIFGFQELNADGLRCKIEFSIQIEQEEHS